MLSHPHEIFRNIRRHGDVRRSPAPDLQAPPLVAGSPGSVGAGLAGSGSEPSVAVQSAPGLSWTQRPLARNSSSSS